MKSVVDNSKLEYLLLSHRIYTPAQRSAPEVVSFEDSVTNIVMNSCAFMEDNACAYDALIPGIFGTLA